LQQVAALALKAGIDMDMVGEGFLTTLKKSLTEGKVTQKEIDDACRLILEAKYKLGLFANPYKFCDVERSKTEIYTPANIKAARTIASESFVLLKNQNNLLPIKKSGTIAVIGPLGDNKANMPGTWSVATDFTKAITVKEGLQNVLGSNGKVLYAKGSNLTADSALEANSTMFGRSLGRDNRTNQQLIDEALAIANQSDVIIATLGEASEMSGESSSRTDLRIPDVQRVLLDALLKTGKPVVLVLFAGRPMVLTEENKKVPAILNAWFGGSEAGNAIADVLFGDVNPSGKLTTSFPQTVGQEPLYYSHKNTGRPLEDGKWFQKFRSNYLDVSNDPLYPFGYGLSYTTFNYSDVKLSSNTLSATGRITASVTVSNTGSKDGYETVQLYTRDLVGSITRPVKELKGFKKIWLKAGESKTISFDINANDLKFYNSDYKYVAEPGDFKVFIGANSRDTKEASFKLL
jgi:beta-glucosidase